MIKSKVKVLLTSALIFFGLGLIVFISSLSIGKLRIIACDVGQGDGILIVTPGGKQIVIDGGEGSRMVDCLGSKMPFWDRNIELMFGTHAQKDHIEAQVSVMERYRVEKIFGPRIGSGAGFYSEWLDVSGREKADIYQASAGDKVLIDRVSIEILWPSADKVGLWRLAAPSDLNETSLVMKLSYRNFCVYFTGDITKEILETLPLTKCQVLKIAHHGSKTGTSRKVLDMADPSVAIIQVGINNRFGHPTKEVLDLLASKGVITDRNDTNGIIEIVSDGLGYKVKAEM